MAFQHVGCFSTCLVFSLLAHLAAKTRALDRLNVDCSVVFEGRLIILAERIEGCVAADGSGCGSLSPEELGEIFVVNRSGS